MRRIRAWVREGLLRGLGVLSKGSLALRRIRLVIPLSWVVLALLVSGLLVVAERGLQVLLIYRAPLRSVQQLSTATTSDSPYYRVAGLAYYDRGYVEYMAVDGQPDTQQYVQHTYYLLLDADGRWGLLVMREGAIKKAGESPLPPKRTIVAGRLVEIDTRVHGLLIEDGWGQPVGMSVALHWMLEEVPLHVPVLELLFLILDMLVIGFLLLSRWFGYVVFWPEPQGEFGPADPTVDPLGRMDMQVTASLPIRGTRQRVRLIEALATLQRDGEDWKVTTYDEGIHSPISIGVPALRIEQIVPARVYFGWLPRWGLLVTYRDRDLEGTARQLSLSFSDPRQRWAVHNLLSSSRTAYERSG
jgi:hypothetical protein